MDAWFGFAAILVGLASCFYGYPLFRILLILAGLLYGYMLGFAWAPASHPGLSLAIALAVAIILAFLAYPLWSLGVILIGAVMGFLILTSAGLALNVTTTVRILMGIVGGGALGLLFYFVRDLIVILVTAFNGSVLAVLGAGWFLPSLAFTGGRGNLLDILLMAVLGACGFAVQYGMFKDRRTYST
jgi:hypothetical protein